MKFNNIYDIDPMDVLLSDRFITRREAERYIKDERVSVLPPERYIELLEENDCLDEELEYVGMTKAEFLAALNSGSFGRSTLDGVYNGLYGAYDEPQYPYVILLDL